MVVERTKAVCVRDWASAFISGKLDQNASSRPALLAPSASSLPVRPQDGDSRAPLLSCYLGISRADAPLFSDGSRKPFKTFLHSDSQG